jgi:hypothetical protein
MRFLCLSLALIWSGCSGCSKKPDLPQETTHDETEGSREILQEIVPKKATGRGSAQKPKKQVTDPRKKKDKGQADLKPEIISSEQQLMDWFWSDESHLMNPNHDTEYYKNIVSQIDKFRTGGGQFEFAEAFEAELRRRAKTVEPSAGTIKYIADEIVRDALKKKSALSNEASLKAERESILKKLSELQQVAVPGSEEVIKEAKENIEQAFGDHKRSL